MLVDGKLCEARSGASFDNIDPAREDVLGVTADGAVEDLGAAVAAARRAADTTEWAADHDLRLHCLRQLHSALNEEQETFRAIDTAESGRPYARTAASIGSNIAALDRWIDLAASYDFEQPLAGGAGVLRREPFGVVGAIFTWNCGFFLNVAKCAPALATGNTLVVCPAAETPWQTTRFGRLIAERTDIPPGVVNIVPSSGPAVPAALTEHPAVDMVTFTGSTTVASKIMAQSSATLKKVLLEGGGKSAAVVLDDADLDTVLPFVVGLLCSNAGQTCAALTRLVLPSNLYDEGIERARAVMAQITCGDPWDPACGQGPQVSARQRDRVLAHIDRAKTEARLVLGGGPPVSPARGFYVEPTIFADVGPSSALAQEEVFGPVLAIIRHDGDDDAVAIANNSRYGLSGAVYSGDTDRALRAARRIRTGQLSVNGAQPFDIGPFGGYKQSGLGREGGRWGFEEYLETKVIAVS